VTATRHILADAQSAAEASARRIIEILDGVLAEREFATFAVSGGSSPKPMFRLLAGSRFPWDRVHIFWVDERCVPPHDPASNFGMIEEAFLVPAKVPSRVVHRIYGELQPPAASARYTDEIRHFFGLRAGEFPHFDLIHRGMGPDGHSASLFPGEPLVDDREKLVAAVWVQKMRQYRITLLPGPLESARNTVFLAPGADKAEALRAVLEGPLAVTKYPAQLGPPTNVEWFVDREAASLLAA
jgi:6-phosphogluconolactonase